MWIDQPISHGIKERLSYSSKGKIRNEKKLCQKITYKYCKDRKNNKSNKNQDLEKKRSLEGPRNVRKYRKNRKSNKDFSC